MNASTEVRWQHLERKPGSAYRQHFVKGTRIMARLLYGMHVNEQDPMTVEEIAAAYQLPVAAVEEAIAYCAADPTEIREDWEMEEASVQAMVKRNPAYVHPAMTTPPLP